MDTPIEVILPCLDEREALPTVLGGLPTGFVPLVVDNGSTDGTPEVARRLGARVVHEPRRGYGAAVHTGVLRARSTFVAVLDADGSLDSSALPALARAVARERTDMAVGRRVPVDRSVFPWHARAGNALLAALLRRRGIPVHDIAPVRVARREAWLGLGVTDRAFGYPMELLLRAAAAGWRIEEFDVEYRDRTGGRSKVSGTLRGTVRAARDMGKVIARM